MPVSRSRSILQKSNTSISDLSTLFLGGDLVLELKGCDLHEAIRNESDKDDFVRFTIAFDLQNIHFRHPSTLLSSLLLPCGGLSLELHEHEI